MPKVRCHGLQALLMMPALSMDFSLVVVGHFGLLTGLATKLRVQEESLVIVVSSKASISINLVLYSILSCSILIFFDTLLFNFKFEISNL